jgi:hypothetical protein
MEETDEVLIGETPGAESHLDSVSLENDPVDETKELAEVAEHNDASTDDEKLLCTEEENVSQVAEASERPMDVQDGQTDTQVGGAAESSSTEEEADQPCSSSETGNALPQSADTDPQSADPSGSNAIAHESGSPVEVDDGKKVVGTTNE